MVKGRMQGPGKGGHGQQTLSHPGEQGMMALQDSGSGWGEAGG